MHEQRSVSDSAKDVEPFSVKRRSLESHNRNPKKEMAGRVVDVVPDAPDLRDRMYEPALIDLQVKVHPPVGITILDQGQEGACTGFGLAAVINYLNSLDTRKGAEGLPEFVSARMLYEMAKLHDEWDGVAYEGSSIRGALKGFYHNGVCSEAAAPYEPDDHNWTLKPEQSKEARTVGLGAYYRLRPNILDYHVALNEAGAIYCSARVHHGWSDPKDGVIEKSDIHTGGHAFAIVGYDDQGFLVQNSWGEDWGGLDGRPGISRWSYQDWAVNIMDAWVLRLSVPAPHAFDVITGPISFFAGNEIPKSPPPRRAEIIGHFANINDAKLVESGPYATPIESLIETSKHLETSAASSSREYDHILIYSHGGLNELHDSARRIHAMKEVYKRNRIYPIHLMWGTGFTDEFFDALTGAFKRSTERVGGVTDFLDKLIEKLSRPVGRAVWRQMKDDARRSFLPGGGGYQVMQMLFQMNSRLEKPYKIHLVGHSAGAILQGYLLDSVPTMSVSGKPIESLSLMAPACTVDLFDNFYKRRIGMDGSPDSVRKATIYRLIDSREEDDSVGKVYRKSLLYLVSNAFEELDAAPLLGMEKFEDHVQLPAGAEVVYAGRDRQRSDSKTHGGFDNDRATMNNVLKSIVGGSWDSSLGFQPEELAGY